MATSILGPTSIGPTSAPFYLATGLVDQIGGIPEGCSGMDFGGNTGRFMARSEATNLAEIELIGASNAADGRQVSYLVFGEYSGPGSASGYLNVPLEVDGNLTADGTIVAKGFADLDIAFSHTRIGVADDLASPMLLMLNASAPTDQKNWVFAALEDSFVFSAATDTGGDFFWMVANRSGTTITDVTFTPPVIAPYLVANGPVPARAALPDGAVAINYSDPVAYIWSKSLGGGLGAIELCGVDNTGREAVYLECAEATPGSPSVAIYAPVTVLGSQLTVYYGNPAVNRVLDVTAPNASLSMFNGNPGLTLINSDAPSSQRVWREEAQNSALAFTAQSDTGAQAAWLYVQRSGNYATEIDFYAPVVFDHPITAPTANFNSCFVGGSPVVTVDTMPPTAPATTNILAGDGEGGFTDTGIDASDVALLDGNNIFTGSVITEGPFSAQTGIIQQLTVGVNILVGNNVTINQNLTAVNGAFSTSLTSQGSPVRTFANTGTGGGPPIPATTNLLAGTGAAQGFADSGIAIDSVALLNGTNSGTIGFSGAITAGGGISFGGGALWMNQQAINWGYQNAASIGQNGAWSQMWLNVVDSDANAVFIKAASRASRADLSNSLFLSVPGYMSSLGDDIMAPKDIGDRDGGDGEGRMATPAASGVWFLVGGGDPGFGIVNNSLWFPTSSTIGASHGASGFLIMNVAGNPVSVPFYNGNAGGGGGVPITSNVLAGDGSGGMYGTGLTLSVGGGGQNMTVPGDLTVGNNMGVNAVNVGYQLQTPRLILTSATATSAVAGAATALPPTPAGYVTIQVGGSNMMVPYYTPAAEVAHDAIEKIKEERGKNGRRAN